MEDTDKLIESLALDEAPPTPAAHPLAQCLEWLAVAALYVALSLVYLGVRPDLPEKMHSPLFVAEIALLAAIVAASALSASLLAFPDMYQMNRLAYAPVWAAMLFIAVIFLAWLADAPPAPQPAHDLECTLCIASLALLPAGWMLRSMRRLASTHRHAAGSVALLSAFALGALALRLSEQTDSIIHVAQWHYLPMAMTAVLGLWLGKLLLKW